MNGVSGMQVIVLFVALGVCMAMHFGTELGVGIALAVYALSPHKLSL